jgi:hypothetical protein
MGTDRCFQVMAAAWSGPKVGTHPEDMHHVVLPQPQSHGAQETINYQHGAKPTLHVDSDSGPEVCVHGSCKATTGRASTDNDAMVIAAHQGVE